MKNLLFLILIVASHVSQAMAQSIRDTYSSKAEACRASNYAYRQSAGYQRDGQIGWEIESGWRPIIYHDRFNDEHSTYAGNMYAYIQVVCGKDTLDDCEIVAWNAADKVVGNQCPEPELNGVKYVGNVATMAIFGAPGETIRFSVVTGATKATLQEREVVETLTFRSNAFYGFVDTDSDGYEDTLRPIVLHVRSNIPGDVNNDGTVSIADLATLIDYFLTKREPIYNADLTGNGTIDLQDLLLLRNLILGIK